MLEFKVECAYASKDKLGESPIWVEEKNSVFWVDIKKYIIHTLNLRTNIHHSWQFNEQISCIAHIKNNKLLIYHQGHAGDFIFGKKTISYFMNKVRISL